MKQILFELKKLQSDRLLTVLGVIAVCVCFLFSYTHAYASADSHRYDEASVRQVLDDFASDTEKTYRIWEEKQQAYRAFLTEDARSDELPPFLADYDVYRRAWERFSRQTRYHDRIDAILRQTQGIDAKSNFLRTIYTRNQALKLSHADVDALPELFDALTLGSFLALFLSALLGVSVSHADRKRGTELLLFSASRGRACARLSKLGAALICMLGLCAILFASAILPFVWHGSFCAWDAYLQNHASFFVCPYPLTVLQAVLLLYLFTVLGAMTLCAVTCTLGKYARHQAVSLLCAAFCVLLLGALAFWEHHEAGNPLHLVSPFSFCNGKTAFGHLYAVQIGSYAIGGLPCIIGAWVVFCAILCIFYVLHHAIAVSSPTKRTRVRALPSVGIPRRAKTVCAFEFGKQMLGNKPILLFVPVFLLFCMQTANAFAPDQGYEEAIYRTYMVRLQGDYTDEKQQLLDQALSDVQHLLSQKEEMDRAFANGDLTRAEMEDYMRRFGRAQLEERALSRVADRLVSVRATLDAGVPAEIVYDSGWNMLFSLRANPLPLLLLCAVCCSLFADEYRRGMHRLFPSEARRRIARSKHIFALCFALCTAILFEAVPLLLLASRVLLPSSLSPSASILSVQTLGACPLLLSAGLSVLCRTAGYLVAASVSTVCSHLFCQKHAAFVCGVLSSLPWVML